MQSATCSLGPLIINAVEPLLQPAGGEGWRSNPWPSDRQINVSAASLSPARRPAVFCCLYCILQLMKVACGQSSGDIGSFRERSPLHVGDPRAPEVEQVGEESMATQFWGEGGISVTAECFAEVNRGVTGLSRTGSCLWPGLGSDNGFASGNAKEVAI